MSVCRQDLHHNTTSSGRTHTCSSLLHSQEPWRVKRDARLFIAILELPLIFHGGRQTSPSARDNSQIPTSHLISTERGGRGSDESPTNGMDGEEELIE